MNDMTQVLGIVVRVDGMLELTNGMKLGATGVDGLGKALDGMAAPAKATTDGVAGVTRTLGGIPAPAKRAADATSEAANAQTRAAASAGQYSQAMRQLPAQITDVVTSLASGMPVWMVAIQQGGQIKDSFGGIGPAFRAVLSTLTPLQVGLGGVAAVAAAFGLAFARGYDESVRINKALVLSGEAAGLTRSQFDAMSRSIAASTGVAVGSVRDINEQVLKLSGLGAASFEATGRAAAALSKITGQSAEEVVKSLQGVTSDAAAFAASANRAYNFLTAAQYAEIRALQAQGREQEAVRKTMELLAGTMEQRQVPALGSLERAVNSVKTSWADFWETMKSIGREQTAEDRLASLKARLDELNGATPLKNASLWQAIQAAFRGGDQTEAGRAAIDKILAGDRQKAQEDWQAASDLVNRDAVRRAEKAIAQQVENDRILRMSSSFQDAIASIERAGADKRLAQSGVDLARRQAQLDRAFQRDEIDAKAYQASLLAIEKARLDAQDSNLQRQIAIERAKRPDTEQGALAQQATLVQLEAQRLAITQQRVRLQAEEDAGNRDVAPKARTAGPSDALRAFKAQDEGNVEAYLAEQRQAREQAAQDLVQSNRQLSIDLIRDDRARGQAQIAAEEETLRKRLDLNSLNAEDRKRVEDEFANWRVLRERQLTEQLRPEWQRMLDDWSDTAKLQRNAYDNAMTGLLRDGEEAFVELGRTGRLNVARMVDGILVELLRLEYRRSVAAPLSGFLGSFLSTLFGAAAPGVVSGGSGLILGGVGGSSSSGGSLYSLAPPPRAAGGPVDRGGLYEVTERGPELLEQGGRTYLMMGSQGGRVIPNQALGGAPAGALPSVSINVTNKGQPASATATVSRSADGGLQIDMLLDAVDDGMADRIASGRGSTYAAIGGRFGLRPAVY